MTGNHFAIINTAPLRPRRSKPWQAASISFRLNNGEDGRGVIGYVRQSIGEFQDVVGD